MSLVTNYRDEFTEQVQTGGIDGLIKIAGGEERRGRREVIHELPRTPAARAALLGRRDGWTFAGALTLDDAADVFEASRGARAARERRSSISAG